MKDIGKYHEREDKKRGSVGRYKEEREPTS